MLFCIQPIRHTIIDSDPAEPLTFTTCPKLHLPFFSRPGQRRRRRLRKRYLDEQKQEPVMAAASMDMRAPSRSNLSMVGSLDQPPPAYEHTSSNGEHKSQPRREFVHMKTTQTVTVTTQVIVPLPSRSERRGPQLDRSGQTGTQHLPRRTLMLNKDLPPPPTDDPDVYTNHQTQSQAPLVPLSATFALAHAALGLGLPSALPQPPRVSISGPPTNPTIQLDDVGSDKGPLARLRAGARANGATIETLRQRTRFISLGVRPTTTPLAVLTNESQLSVEPTPRTSSSAFGKKVRRAKSFTGKLRSAVGSP